MSALKEQCLCHMLQCVDRGPSLVSTEYKACHISRLTSTARVEKQYTLLFRGSIE